MKWSKIAAFKCLLTCDSDGNIRSRMIGDFTIEESDKHDGYENVTATFTGTYVPQYAGHEQRNAGPARRQLLFLDPYGEEMPTDMKKRLNVDFDAVCIDYETSIVYGADAGEEISTNLFLRPLGVLRRVGGRERRKRANIAKVRADLYTKRPYHFEIDWWTIEEFLAGEVGWSTLRENVKVVVLTGKWRYEASLEP